MPYLLSYTKKDDIYSTLVDRPKNMSGNLYFSDVYEAMHLALSRDGSRFVPLRNNTGILFPKATFTEGKPEGTTKTLRYTWMFDRADGTYGVCGVRRNEDGPDPLSIGCVMLFSSKDLIRYEEVGFLKVADEEVMSPRCRYDEKKGKYYLEYGTAQGIFCGYTADFVCVDEVRKIREFTLKNAVIEEISCGNGEFGTVTEICLSKGRNPDEKNPDEQGKGEAYVLNWEKDGKTNVLNEEEDGNSIVPNRREDGKTNVLNGKEDGKSNTLKGETRGKVHTVEEKKENILCGNVLKISEEAADQLEKYLGVISHVSVDPIVWEVAIGENRNLNSASQNHAGVDNHLNNASGRTPPRALCRYSDGSVHEKPVDWDASALAAIDFTKPGIYEVPGHIRQKHWPFPMMKEGISDPCITYYKGKYYLSATGMRDVSFRISDTIEGCFRAKRKVVWSLPKGDRKHANIWAQELHIIRGVPYVFTTVASPEWYTVRSHILRCTGDIADPKAWEEPRLCVKTDGTPLEEHGISLDMTYFCVDDIHYVMWSNRVIHINEPGYMGEADSEGTDSKAKKKEKDKLFEALDSGENENPQKKNSNDYLPELEDSGKNRKKEREKGLQSESSACGAAQKKEKKKKDVVVCEPADIFIATIDPDAPWQLTSDPVRVLRPQYGWDRLNTEVDEGPYLLRHGDDLFVTISGSSTGVADLYCLGLLHARAGSDLLRPENWDWMPYPVLTKESVPGEFGPGHNNFVRDAETGDDLMVYHAVPHDEKGKSLGRHAGIRRVHWAANGYPYLEMTEERDLDPALRDIVMKVVVG
ncbi:MAG: family 43 glycosylhydrolase [Lachnospiraceae bacterium]|nr:family 43 glycosylhydrolase [Lachnospiraceae bacterium]